MDSSPSTSDTSHNHSKSSDTKKLRLFDHDISKKLEEPLSSDEEFYYDSDTDLGEGDSADDDVDYYINTVNESEIENYSIVREVSPLCLDETNNIDRMTMRNELPLINSPSVMHRQKTEQPTNSQTNNHIWLDNSPDVDPIVFKENTGFKIKPNGEKPIDFFNLLLTDDFYNFILEETNSYAVDLYTTYGTSNKSRISKWTELTKNELKSFFGLVFHTGTIKMPWMSDYWKTDKLFNLNCFRNIMSRNRYMLIMRALHFCRNPEPGDYKPSRLYKIEKFVEYFNNRMLEVYQPSKQLSLDKSMVLWRGQLVFRQYIKNKRHKYGIKLYMLTEPNGLVQNILIYSGQGTDRTPEKSHTEYVVYRLMENYLDKGHSLFMDNYYNSITLAHALLERKTYCTGTLRTNRKNNPKEIVSKNLKTGESICKYTKYGVCVVKWKDKSEVLAISSEYENEIVEVRSKYGRSKLKPLPISEYNKYMSGIDRQAQIMSYYPCERKKLRWYKKMGLHFLQIILLNSYLLYCKNVKKITYYDFRLSVINSLLPSNNDTKQLPCSPRLPQNHLPVKVDKNNKSRYIRKRCRLCANKGKREETIYYCNKCESQPGLCLAPCFEEYHSKI